MIDYDLSAVKSGYDGWYVDGRAGRLEFLGVPHAINCRCSERARDCYERYVSGTQQKTMAEQFGISPARVGQLVSRVRLCKKRAIRHALNAFTGMSERDALCLISYLNGIAEAAQPA